MRCCPRRMHTNLCSVFIFGDSIGTSHIDGPRLCSGGKWLCMQTEIRHRSHSRIKGNTIAARFSFHITTTLTSWNGYFLWFCKHHFDSIKNVFLQMFLGVKNLFWNVLSQCDGCVFIFKNGKYWLKFYFSFQIGGMEIVLNRNLVRKGQRSIKLKSCEFDWNRHFRAIAEQISNGSQKQSQLFYENIKFKLNPKMELSIVTDFWYIAFFSLFNSIILM